MRVSRAFSPIRAEYVYRILCQVNALLLSILQSLVTLMDITTNIQII